MSTLSDKPESAPEEGAAMPMPLLDLGAFHVLRDVEVEITVEIGRCRKRIAEVLRLRPGQTMEIPKAAGEPVDIYVNRQLLGRGEAIVLGDRYGVRITELASMERDKP
jgi:flagellar motor switch protein FliN/FliY